MLKQRRISRSRRSTFEALEMRILRSATDPGAQEQELLWLVNRMRTRPAEELALLLGTADAATQEALAYFQVDQALLAQQWATLAPAQPLAWNAALAAAAEFHNAAMAEADIQAHQVPGEPPPDERMLAAGYSFSAAAENIYAYAVSMIHAHAALAIDWGNAPGDIGGIQNPPNHRLDMMNGIYRDVGIGALYSNIPGKTTGPFLVTQDFGAPLEPVPAMLVGTAFLDQNTNVAYNAGEGLGGITVIAQGDAGVFETQTRTHGGYQMALPPGVYTVSFLATGAVAELIPPNATFSITVDQQNLLQDLRLLPKPPDPPPPPPPPDTLKPIGSLDVMETWPTGAPRRIRGWAFDVDAANAAIQVRLDINDSPGSAVMASIMRKDLAGAIGSTDHGYLLEVPPLPPGRHTLRVVALDFPTGAATTIGTRTIEVGSTAFGSVDVFDTIGGIRGWAFDPVAGSEPIKVFLSIDGKPTAPVAASVTRNDLVPHFGSANHGFTIPQQLVPFGPHLYEVFAIGAGGRKTLLATKTHTALPPMGSLDIATAGRIGGWGMDPNGPAAPGTVRIDIDGQHYRTFTTAIGRADLAAFGPGKYGFEIVPPALAAGTHTIDMYLVDDGSRIPIPMARRTLHIAAAANRMPIGTVDVLSTGLVGGWVVDPDAQDEAVNVQIRINGIEVQTLEASRVRPDLSMLFVSNAHGYATPLPGLETLSAGSHHVEVFALDKQTLEPVLLGKGDITVG